MVLLSGGLDSTTVLVIATSKGFRCHALTFSYGQRHVSELESARKVAEWANVASHTLVEFDMGIFGGSSLTTDAPVPRDRARSEMGNDIPSTYVPARNTIFLSFALAHAEVIGAADIFLGVNALDYSGYPDCRPEYITAFEHMALLATRAGVEGQRLRIHTPLIDLTKTGIIQLGTELGVDYGLTSTCYDPDASGAACGRCDACTLRLDGFAHAGIPDPVRYQVAT